MRGTRLPVETRPSVRSRHWPRRESVSI
jgi:hypothetical protein